MREYILNIYIERGRDRDKDRQRQRGREKIDRDMGKKYIKIQTGLVT